MSTIIYIYSKYSNHCNNLNNIVQQIQHINPLSIDNPISRKRILSNHNLNINQVPTIIVNSDTIKIYEGEIATKFLLNVYDNMFPKEEQIIENKEELIIENKEEPIVENKEVSNIDDIIGEEDNEVESKEVENKEVDLMSKVEELQKMRNSMIESEGGKENESDN